MKPPGSRVSQSSACKGGGDSEGPLTNSDPGINDLNVVVAFGDSITQGSECPCVPYPARLSGLIGKVVYNTGVGGSRATANINRTQQAINNQYNAFVSAQATIERAAAAYNQSVESYETTTA